MVYVSGGVIRDVMPWGRGSCGSCNPKLYSHSAGSLRIRFFFRVSLPDIVVVGAGVESVAAGDASVVDDVNDGDDDDDVEEEAAVVSVSVSAMRVDSEHWVVRTTTLRDDKPGVMVVVDDVVNENAYPREEEESKTTSSKADTEKWLVIVLLFLLLLDLALPPRNLSNSN